ncbi:MAG: hypothetical protein H8D84_02665 [Proteobacteria bacterium]|nr:hypothetical protein [Pseudomonadota bacterium]
MARNYDDFTDGDLYLDTSGQIDVVQLYKAGATFNANSEITVYGTD